MIKLAQDDKAALHEIGNDRLEPLALFDIPDPGDVVGPFDKINEIISEKKETAREAEQIAALSRSSAGSVNNLMVIPTIVFPEAQVFALSSQRVTGATKGA